MKTILACACALLLFSVLCASLVQPLAQAQDAKPAPVMTEADRSANEFTLTDETERMKIQTQLLLQENASLRKQLAQAQRQLGEANAQLAELNGQSVQDGGGLLVKQLADKHGLKIEDYEFKIEPGGEMKFVRKMK